MATAKQKALQRRKKIALSILIFSLVLVTIAAVYLSRYTIAVLQPAGQIASGEKRLLVNAFLLMLIVVVPVFVLAFGFAWRYRESNKAAYMPNWDHSRVLETIWWLVPSTLIAVLAVATWVGTYAYAPSKPINSSVKPLTIQVVALDWRWLFIYPDQKVASINQLQIPAGVPVNFEITADAPMNSFWIPQLGGQIYAMPGMNSTLHLQADKTGTYRGVSANISGKGFANMNFQAIASSKSGFDAWVKRAAIMPELTDIAYDELASQSTDQKTYLFRQPESQLYAKIMSKNLNNQTGVTDITAEAARTQMQMSMEHM